jgi:hypothetical protein
VLNVYLKIKILFVKYINVEFLIFQIVFILKKERKEMKKLILIVLISINLFGEQKNNIDINSYLDKTESWKKELTELMNNKNKTIDNKKYLEMIDTGKDGTFMGKKMATIKLPERSSEFIEDPLERANLADKSLIEKEYKEISKKSNNMAKLYKFLATYGKEPSENGTLENEKELYDLIKKGELKLSSKKVKEQDTPIKPINHFLKLSR